MALFFRLVFVLIVLCARVKLSEVEVDVSWDFNANGEFEGWANATAEEMGMEVHVENGELRGSLIGQEPILDSPFIFLQATPRHYTVVRMNYFGSATQGRLLIYGESKYGFDPIVNSVKSSSVQQQNSICPALPQKILPTSSKSTTKSVFMIPVSASDSLTSKTTKFPTSTPTSGPTTAPFGPTFEPTFEPTAEPSSEPSAEPTFDPTAEPTLLVTTEPTSEPTVNTAEPTVQPTLSPISEPTAIPTPHPTHVSELLESPSFNTVCHLTDKNPYTYYLSQASSGIFVVFDLSASRWITSISILPIGDSRSPRRCVLQRSVTGGVGPFLTVSSFSLSAASGISSSTNATSPSSVQPSVFSGFNEYGRYWRLLVLDNFGGDGIGIREVTMQGYNENVAVAPFSLDNTGMYKTYYLPVFQYILGPILRMRFQFIRPRQVSNHFREGLTIDFVRIARAPDIWRVRGCVDKYSDRPSFQILQYNVTAGVTVINEQLPLRYFVQNSMNLQYATTYDCPLTGGTAISVEGQNFGRAARVFVDGNECPVKSHGLGHEGGRVESLVCVLPPGASGTKVVRVENGVNPGLFQEVPSLQYRVAPPVMAAPIVTNIGACRVDLVWTPPGDVFSNMMTTGYKILWFRPKFSAFISNLTVGNVTTTSVRGLLPGTEYVFAIAPMAEGAFEGSAVLPTDLYGRRAPTPTALIGTFSTYTNVTGTAQYDFEFAGFSANITTNSSNATFSQSLGPTGMYGAEGAYGLVLVGSTNVQNCNVSSTCCDGYNPAIGVTSCGTTASVCAVLPARMLEYPFVIDGVTRRQTPSNLPYPDATASAGQPEIVIFTLNELIANGGAALPSIACGPSLRLTPSEARQSGAGWYRRKVNVREGFDTTIQFEISNPSLVCNIMDDVNTYCRSRGADGFSFVIQNQSPVALGLAGSGLGYDGIFNSLAVEVDTFHNYDQMDFYENHIAVMTQGWRYNITANHSRSLATTTRIPDMTDGRHTLRIRYDPNFDADAILHPSFQVNGFTTWFLENADFQYGGEGDWGTGFGLLYVYLDDLYSPVITTVLNLDATLNLDNGRAFVGITAATGDHHWQAHDILDWKFQSLFIDQTYEPPVQVNGEGAFDCVNASVCVHRPEYNNYMRTSDLWADGAVSFDPFQGFT